MAGIGLVSSCISTCTFIDRGNLIRFLWYETRIENWLVDALPVTITFVLEFV